jgi:hypothetical protein
MRDLVDRACNFLFNPVADVDHPGDGDHGDESYGTKSNQEKRYAA